tara:strand:+ start:197 stop:343 length:147 start_codon:yes stop_codon:yes gene_type:complete
MESLQQQLREAEQNYTFHKSRSEWFEAGHWADIYSQINKQIHNFEVIK